MGRAVLLLFFYLSFLPLYSLQTPVHFISNIFVVLARSSTYARIHSLHQLHHEVSSPSPSFSPRGEGGCAVVELGEEGEGFCRLCHQHQAREIENSGGADPGPLPSLTGQPRRTPAPDAGGVAGRRRKAFLRAPLPPTPPDWTGRSM